KDIPIVIFTVKDVTELDKVKLGRNITNIINKADFSKKGLLNEIKKLEMAYPAKARMIDPLTGVFNNRYFNHWIAQEIERGKRYGFGFSVLLVDMDRLHNYNARNGFSLGNEALVLVAKLIKDNIRTADCLIRYNGDAFIVILHNVGREAAVAVAEKLRVKVENYQFPSAGGKKDEKLTISVGVACFPADGAEKDELMSNVQGTVKSAFQYASLSGGNRVSIFRKGL
ncbi:MAG: GGDEF domain-containing protein, partial [Nitrospinota bacterium]